ncbi:hypothetical protein BGY98DRAFT_985629 [Russula aff. rugulosa BPL654]|nr:hypothetical protein BGY98DRAFT_985629 [Russula aff. rugulosa BPL654]
MICFSPLSLSFVCFPACLSFLCYLPLPCDPNDIAPTRAAEPPHVSSSGLASSDLIFSRTHKRAIQPRYTLLSAKTLPAQSDRASDSYSRCTVAPWTTI